MTSEQQALNAAQIQRRQEMEMTMRIERAAAGMTAGLSNDDIMSPEMMAFYGVEPETSPEVGGGGTPPERAATGPRIITDPIDGGGGGGGDSTAVATPQGPATDVPYPRTQDVNNSSELLAALNDNKIPVNAAPPPELISEIEEGVKNSDAPDAVKDVAESAVNNLDPRNPVGFALQLMGIEEVMTTKDGSRGGKPLYEVVTAGRDTIPTEKGVNQIETIMKANPKGAELLQDIWTTLGLDADTAKKWTYENQAWCAGFVNYVLTKANLPTMTSVDDIEDTEGLLAGLGSNTVSTLNPGKVKYAKAGARNYVTLGEEVYSGPDAVGLKHVKEPNRLPTKASPKPAEGKNIPAQVGDIVVVKKGGHVGFFAGYDDKGRMLLLGGNQGQKVSLQAYKQDQVTAVRRVTNATLTDKEQEKLSLEMKNGATESTAIQ